MNATIPKVIANSIIPIVKILYILPNTRLFIIIETDTAKAITS